MDIEDEVLAIDNQEDFVVFLANLKNELNSGGDNWENNTLSLFLEGMRGYCQDAKIDELNWKSLGEILLTATVYE